MRPSKKLRISSVSLLLLLCALHIAPRVAAQVSCVVTYNCRSSQCAAAVAGPRTLNYPNEQACIDAAKTVGDGKIASCSCGSPAAPAAGASTAVAPAAPGHEFDNTIHQAIAAGMAGKVSPGNAVGLIGLGLLGNALFAPKTTNPVQPEAQPQVNLAAQQLNNSGLYLFRQKNYAGAINEFQKALAQAPNDASIINNLALAKQQLVIQQLNLKMATQTSGALGQLLGDAPPNTGLFDDQLPHSPVMDQKASPLSLVDLGSDAGVVDLGSATGTSVDPDSLKDQLDGVLANHTLSTTAPDPRVEMPEVQDIELLLQPPQSTASQFPGPQRPANSPKLVNPMMDAEERAQVEAIFAQPGSLEDTLEKQALDVKAKPPSDPSLKDALNDSRSSQNGASVSASNSPSAGQTTTGSGTGFFGSPSNPSNPELETSAAAQPITIKSTTDSLTSAVNSGAAASANGISKEAAAMQARCILDAEACAKPAAPIPTNKGIAQTPGTVELARHIPPTALRGDTAIPEIQQDVAYYQKLDGKKIETQNRIAAIQQQINNDPGNAAMLNLQKATLTNDLNNFNRAQVDTQTQIKTILVKHNLQWNEDPQQTTTSTPAKP